jgi:hypothetical protein
VWNLLTAHPFDRITPDAFDCSYLHMSVSLIRTLKNYDLQDMKPGGCPRPSSAEPAPLTKYDEVLIAGAAPQ